MIHIRIFQKNGENKLPVKSGNVVEKKHYSGKEVVLRSFISSCIKQFSFRLWNLSLGIKPQNLRSRVSRGGEVALEVDIALCSKTKTETNKKKRKKENVFSPQQVYYLWKHVFVIVALFLLY